MDLKEFTQITLTVLEDQGTESYAPTLMAGDSIQVIQGIPEGLDHRVALQETLHQLGLDHAEFYFGVRSGPGEVTTGHHTVAFTQFQLISQLHQGFVVTDLPDCPWWTLGRGRDQ
jgi:hypothetical protein